MFVLVLTRSIDEKIIIGDDVVVTVAKVHSNQVHIGIEAPIEIPVYREENDQRILKEKAIKRIRASLFPHQSDC